MLYVANSASNNVMVFDTATNPPALITTIDLRIFGTAPRALAVTDDGDTNDSNETIFATMFYGQLRAGKTSLVGAEIRQTLTLGSSVLFNVGTFTLGGGRTNEVRFNGADISQAINPLGANGFNIPSLLSVAETAPYFYNGLAQTLEQVLDGSQDNNGGTRHHFVTDVGQRAALVKFLRSIDETTPIFP